MLEWSICSDCGTILDKSQETCQNCHTSYGCGKNSYGLFG